MNLALHGFLLQVFVSILNFHHGLLLCSAGEPGYLDFDNLPETNFSCQGKVIGGYYADVEAGCQMFHVCTIGQKDEIMDIKFLCLNGTVFDQETRVCERVDEVDCSKSERFYNLNLELYGNNAVTLSLHDSDDDDDDLPDIIEDHPQRTTSARPSTTSTTSTTTLRPSTTAASGSFQHPAGYPQHYQPQPPFPQIHTSQSKSLYDDKNGGYHHQYIFHNGERTNNQATSYQLFSNPGVSSTTISPPQIHQIRFSSTVGPQIIHNEPSTVTPLFHATSSTIQTLLNSNANSPALINPIFHNHGIASTTEQFNVHSNNPRETADYRDEGEHEQSVRPLEPIQPTNKGKISKLTISPIPTHQETPRTVQTKTSQKSQQPRIPNNFLPTPATIETTIRSFYPTPRPSPKPSSSQSVTHQVSRHIHVSSPVTIPQLKPHQITINLPPPDIQRIVQNPSPLLPSQSRVIVTAKASVSDESGRPLNTTQLVTLPLPTIPASYDDYKEGDESFDPFYRDVPKIRKSQRIAKSVIQDIKSSRRRRSSDQSYHSIHGTDSQTEEFILTNNSESHQNEDSAANKKNAHIDVDTNDFEIIKKTLMKFRDILFSDKVDQENFHGITDDVKSESANVQFAKQAEDNAVMKLGTLEDLKMDASKHLDLNKLAGTDVKSIKSNASETITDMPSSKRKYTNETLEMKSKSDLEINTQSTSARPEPSESHKDMTDITILDSDNDSTPLKTAPSNSNSLVEKVKIDAPIEIIIEEETQSGSRDISEANERIVHNEQFEGSSLIVERKDSEIPHGTSRRKGVKNVRERKPGSRRRNSRIRSSRRRISSKLKQQKMTNIDVTESIQREKEINEETSTITNNIATPAIVPFEAKIGEQINSHILEEPESQIFKEVDTRAVGHNGTKSLRDSKSHDLNKDEEIERSFDHQIIKSYAKNLEQFINKNKQEQSEAESIDHTQSTVSIDVNTTENSEAVEEVGSTTIANNSEGDTSFDEFSSTEYDRLDDDSSTVISGEGFDDSSEETPKKVPTSDEVTTSFENVSDQEHDYEDSSNKSSDLNDDFVEERHTTGKSGEEINSEESNEYQDTTKYSEENTRDTSIQENYKDTDSTEDFMSKDYTTSEEYPDSQEDVADSTEGSEDSTEGILKFTDELPKTEHTEEAERKEVSTSDESNTQDYVDDNYEPENYKELESTTKSSNVKDEKSERKNDKDKNVSTKYSKDTKTNEEEDDIEGETHAKHTEGVTEVVDLDTEVAHLGSSNDTSSTTIPAIAITTTTSRPTVTTSHTTPPKLFKPSLVRRTYAYVPPTTTPNPVIIKPRLGLFNPKPAKPPKSYNELAPKPVIRKHPFLSRKSITTATITSDAIEISTTADRTTAASPVAVNTDTASTIGITTIKAVAEKTKSDIQEIITEPIVITTESRKSEENVLGSKLETQDHESISSSASADNDATNREDQLPSSSEQDTPTNSSRDAELPILDKEIEPFTDFPLLRLSTLAPTIGEAVKKVETKQDITERTNTFLASSPPTTFLPDKSSYVETSTQKFSDAAVATVSSTKVYQNSTEVLAVLSKRPVTPPTTIQPTVKNIVFDQTTEAIAFRSDNRKTTTPRRHVSFNCLEKEMYRFYGDTRDCRLFHYCSPGFTSRQVLDFRFVCEEGTAFDEETRSCRHDVRNRKCRHKS